MVLVIVSCLVVTLLWINTRSRSHVRRRVVSTTPTAIATENQRVSLLHTAAVAYLQEEMVDPQYQQVCKQHSNHNDYDSECMNLNILKSHKRKVLNHVYILMLLITQITFPCTLLVVEIYSEGHIYSTQIIHFQV